MLPRRVRQIRKRAGFVHMPLVAGLVLALCSCGTSAATISGSSEVNAIHEAGFNVHRITSTTMATSGGHLPFVDLLVVRFPSSGRAERTYANGYSPASLRKQVHEARTNPLYAGILPPSFKSSMIHARRICNVIVASYNPHSDPLLTARFARVVSLLQAGCR